MVFFQKIDQFCEFFKVAKFAVYKVNGKLQSQKLP